MIITYNENSKKLLKKSLIIISVILFIFIIGIILLKYEVEGENKDDLPFRINEIKIAGKIDAIKNKDNENIWNLNLLLINDIYINVEAKNEKIKSIKIKDIKINNNKIGNNKTIKLNDNYNSENLNELEFVGGTTTNIDNMTISNQGGTIVFRNIIENIANYISNDEEIVYDNELLKKAGIEPSEIQTTYTFTLIIETAGVAKYSTKISLELPTKRQKIENIDISKIIFKRILQN